MFTSSPSLISLSVSVDVKQHLKMKTPPCTMPKECIVYLQVTLILRDLTFKCDQGLTIQQLINYSTTHSHRRVHRLSPLRWIDGEFGELTWFGCVLGQMFAKECLFLYAFQFTTPLPGVCVCRGGGGGRGVENLRTIAQRPTLAQPSVCPIFSNKRGLSPPPPPPPPAPPPPTTHIHTEAEERKKKKHTGKGKSILYQR